MKAKSKVLRQSVHKKSNKSYKIVDHAFEITLQNMYYIDFDKFTEENSKNQEKKSCRGYRSMPFQKHKIDRDVR